VAEGATVETALGRRQLVVFSLGQESYGVDIYRVREIIRVPAITRVPRAPEYVEGVINLRGGVIPVIDLRKRFGMEKGEVTDERRIVVAELGSQTVGVIVDGVSEVLEVNEADIAPPSGVCLDGRHQVHHGHRQDSRQADHPSRTGGAPLRPPGRKARGRREQRRTRSVMGKC